MPAHFEACLVSLEQDIALGPAQQLDESDTVTVAQLIEPRPSIAALKLLSTITD
jgi:hypothetical protein